MNKVEACRKKKSVIQTLKISEYAVQKSLQEEDEITFKTRKCKKNARKDYEQFTALIDACHIIRIKHSKSFTVYNYVLVTGLLKKEVFRRTKLTILLIHLIQFVRDSFY